MRTNFEIVDKSNNCLRKFFWIILLNKMSCIIYNF